jgi:hypothetical protein
MGYSRKQATCSNFQNKHLDETPPRQVSYGTSAYLRSPLCLAPIQKLKSRLAVRWNENNRSQQVSMAIILYARREKGRAYLLYLAYINDLNIVGGNGTDAGGPAQKPQSLCFFCPVQKCSSVESVECGTRKRRNASAVTIHFLVDCAPGQSMLLRCPNTDMI